MRRTASLATGLAALWLAGPAGAVTGVNPNGVNVNASGVTTVFLSFQGLAPDEVPVAAFWCAEITVPANTVVGFNPCVSGTLLGNLLARNDLARRSVAGGAASLTDIMTIPASVARRAYQLAQDGADSSFFYVRQFRNMQTGAISFVAVTCRLAGGGARAPLALTRVDIHFVTGQQPEPTVLYLGEGELPPPVAARIQYNGAGNLRGRWEVVLPGETQPDAVDLLPEPSLPVEQRGTQRHYTVIGRFDVFLPPQGDLLLEGPEPKLIPTDVAGPYLVLLRIEASADKEGDSNTGAGVVQSGGVAGFPLPVLRYYVGSPESSAISTGASVQLMQPADGTVLATGAPLGFEWLSISEAAAFRLELRDETGERLSAVVSGKVHTYRTPPWISEQPGALRWQVQALDDKGDVIGRSRWQKLFVE